VKDYPQYYHSLLAEDRLKDDRFNEVRAKEDRAGDAPMPRLKEARLDSAKVGQTPNIPAGVSPSVATLLKDLPAAPSVPVMEPSADWKENLHRIRLLDRLGLKDFADRELRFRADSPRFAYYAGFDLAERAGQRGSYHQAIRYLKRYTPGYLAFRLDAMPRRYWELLFPMPWREQIESYSKQNNLDPYLVAALIRQESEFNPGAVSRAHALGLMQIMPATSRKLTHSMGIRPVPVSGLYVPQTSLQLGTHYLRNVLDQYSGKVEPALAGYNAGEHRADRWLGWHSLDDPAEFVESIPFAETRDYVESVLRNAEIYRRIYSGG
jgi:soluble lytic murein transglycosylase